MNARRCDLPEKAVALVVEQELGDRLGNLAGDPSEVTRAPRSLDARETVLATPGERASVVRRVSTQQSISSLPIGNADAARRAARRVRLRRGRVVPCDLSASRGAMS